MTKLTDTQAILLSTAAQRENGSLLPLPATLKPGGGASKAMNALVNSLDAQREACAAYILSQASEGWSALPEVYDDGGLSGGTLARPTLQRLLAEVAAGRVDIIVV